MDRAVAPQHQVGRIGAEPLPDHLPEVRAADLLLAVENHADAARDATGQLAQRPQAEQLREVLPLVVAGAPPVHPAGPDLGGERRRHPFVQGPAGWTS